MNHEGESRAGRSRRTNSWEMTGRKSSAGQVRQDIERVLRERVKELNCLYEISQLIERHGNALDQILQGLTELLPSSWQYPEVAAARVEFENDAYESDGFQVTPWIQATPIVVSGEARGRVEVCYLEDMPALDEGPFLREERQLIDAVAQRTGKAIERIQAQAQLEEERKALERKGIALQEILERLREEKRASAEHILANLEQVVLPILHALASRLPDDQRKFIQLAERSMMDVLSPFTRGLARQNRKLSPAEIQVCSLIRHGLRSKEIAQLRGISLSTVHRHRERVREKLGIKNEKVNLATFLGGDPDAPEDLMRDPAPSEPCSPIHAASKV